MENPSRKIIAMPVYSIHEGQSLGKIRSLVINPDKKEVLALLVEKRSLMKETKIIFFNHIKSIGENVITLDKSSYMQVQKNASFPEALQYIRRPVKIIGCKVLTESGRDLGRVEEFYIDCTSGKITRLQLSCSSSGGFFKDSISLPAEHIVTIGADVLIADNAAAEELLIHQHNIKQTMGKASDVWSNTSKKISDGLKAPVFRKDIVTDKKGDKPKKASRPTLRIAAKETSSEPSQKIRAIIRKPLLKKKEFPCPPPIPEPLVSSTTSVPPEEIPVVPPVPSLDLELPPIVFGEPPETAATEENKEIPTTEETPTAEPAATKDHPTEEAEMLPKEQEEITLFEEMETTEELEAEDIEQTASVKPDVPQTEPLQPPRIKYTITTNLETKK